MMARMEVAGRMLVRGRVAAANVPAGQAQSQMHPKASDSQTIFTAVGARGYWFDLIKVWTSFSHGIHEMRREDPVFLSNNKRWARRDQMLLVGEPHKVFAAPEERLVRPKELT